MWVKTVEIEFLEYSSTREFREEGKIQDRWFQGEKFLK